MKLVQMLIAHLISLFQQTKFNKLAPGCQWGNSEVQLGQRVALTGIEV
jgi:hypothetical protein